MADNLNLRNYAGGYSSEFDDNDERSGKNWRSDELAKKWRPQIHQGAVPSKSTFAQEYEREERKSHMFHFLALDAYSRHKKLVNDYLKYYGGKLEDFQRSTANDRTDADVIREHHKFIWEDDEEDISWEKRLAKKYYDKLFKEYCVSDLTRYKENKVALRWRIEKEVIDGKGQFVCGNKKCNSNKDLRSWEVNFAYVEEGLKKNALVKLRLCPECSTKLNYHHRRSEAKKGLKGKSVLTKKAGKKRKKNKKEKKKRKKGKKQVEDRSSSEPEEESESDTETEEIPRLSEKSEDHQRSIWQEPVSDVVEKTRTEEFEEYLEDLFV